MKKKGLIISTVVMVVVLIASLTTATYAWFTSQSVAMVGSIEMSTTSSNTMSIGAKTGTAAGAGIANYSSGEVQWDATAKKWTGPGDGVGSSINFMTGNVTDGYNPLSFALTKAVTITTENKYKYDASDKESAFIAPGKFITANGEGLTVPTTCVDAEANKDYFDATIFAIPAAANSVKQAWCAIKVTPTNKAKLGMAAAIRFKIQVGTGAEFITDSYKGKTQVQQWKETVTEGEYNAEDGSWTYYIELLAFNTSNFYGTEFAVGKEIKITAWLEGTDDSCISANAGTGATIDITFDASDSTEYTIANGKKTEA